MFQKMLINASSLMIGNGDYQGGITLSRTLMVQSFLLTRMEPCGQSTQLRVKHMLVPQKIEKRGAPLTFSAGVKTLSSSRDKMEHTFTSLKMVVQST